MSAKKLIKFEAKRSDANIWDIYIVYGDRSMQQLTDAGKEPYMYPEFANLHTARMADGGKLVSYKPDNCSFAGRPYTEEDMIFFCMTDLMRQCETGYRIVFLTSALKAWMNWYLAPEQMVDLPDGTKVPRYAFHVDADSRYKLSMVTDQNIYYVNVNSGLFLMLNKADNSLIFSNSFAEDGYWESVRNIYHGTETRLFGKLPVLDDDDE